MLYNRNNKQIKKGELKMEIDLKLLKKYAKVVDVKTTKKEEGALQNEDNDKS